MITPEIYEELCSACDKVLAQFPTDVGLLSVPCLHVIREHPTLLARYWRVIGGAKGKVFSGVFLGMAKRGRWLWRALRAPNKPWIGAFDANTSIDYIFVSHLLSIDHLAGESDFYFGTATRELQLRGKSALLVLINYTGESSGKLAEQLRSSPVPRVVLSQSLPLRSELANWWAQRKVGGRIRRMAGFASDIQRGVVSLAAREAASPDALSALRAAQTIANIAEQCQPSTIVTTFEGHAWERAIYAATHRMVPGIRCVGYQHAALFQLQHAALRPLGHGADPDSIMTVGAVTQERLREVYAPRNVPVGIVGSARSWQGKGAFKGGQACLVLPEGIEAECEILFRFSLASARACPEIRFIWRTHPILPFARFARKYRGYRELPPNVAVSTSDLQDDIAASSWGLYRGSTAIIAAVGAGVIPVYLSLPGELSIDPLFSPGLRHPQVGAVDDFAAVIRNATRNNSLEAFCREYFLPWQHQAW
jgi:hypothetical protein